jgi:hypothetical protein
VNLGRTEADAANFDQKGGLSPCVFSQVSSKDEREGLALVKVTRGEGGFRVIWVTSAEAEREFW